MGIDFLLQPAIQYLHVAMAWQEDIRIRLQKSFFIYSLVV